MLRKEGAEKSRVGAVKIKHNVIDNTINFHAGLQVVDMPANTVVKNHAVELQQQLNLFAGDRLFLS